ncbi:bifunctional serine/threonine-protein kinase/ABC transporter substrate-binding protein [Streptomyces sp. NPDC048566]|uniref:bifunctional serine/threonine-protein kinase/ABC transporter substrate-binding protein n=1 Tax=Streptomyces sp. NPDC048566 TaxID=3365569 RepID=UPI003710EDF8
MEPLRVGDPSRMGRYRLLRRLGAGGMGVVFLARAPGGAVAAVKTVRSSYADERGFRTRFHREVEAARHVRSPWVVPLLDADAEADTPWLATGYVPGPSLAEAVYALGPLPLASVRVLAVRLGEALQAVHDAGLVHRDVKPGNVLLAPDGPRLIDFGIARAPEATALTATGVVVGSPGFLSPEQARARNGETGAPSDVFSLGCLLAFAATGIRPFGDGAPAGMLWRTLYEDPDPAALPQELAPLLRACLSKDPHDRPSLAQVRAALGPRDTFPEIPASDWLPARVTRLINTRSAAVLAIGTIEPTRVPPPPKASGAIVSPDAPTMTAVASPGSRPWGRRGVLWLGATAGLLAAGGGAWWWQTGATAPQPPTPGTRRARPEVVVAFHGDLTGTGRMSGRAQLNAARLAVARVNGRGDHPVRLALRAYDDGGEEDRAADLATRLAKDARVLAVLGPTSDVCFHAADTAYTEAVLPAVSVSVGADTLGSTSGTSVFHCHAALSVTHAQLAAPLVRYLVRHVDSRRVLLVDDRAQGGFAETVCAQTEQALRWNGRDTDTVRVPAATFDPGALAARATASQADAVVFAGGPDRAAGLASALTAVRFGGTRMATERALDPRFLVSAGDAANGWVLATSFTDPTARASARAFSAAYRARFGADPGWYAAEAWDGVMFLAEACHKNGVPLTERGAIARRMPEITYSGITRTIRYEMGYGYSRDAMFHFRVDDGRFRYLGQYQGSAVS